MSVLPVLDCMRMILLMDSWYENGYNELTQIVGNGRILIALTLTVRVRCTFVLCAKNIFVNHLAVVVALSITVYLYFHSTSLFVIILPAILCFQYFITYNCLIINTIQCMPVLLCMPVVCVHGNECAIRGISTT